MREEIVEGVRSGNEIAGIVTRNGYGALVLNARQALFIDVDRPAPASPGLLGRLFGKPASAGDDAALTRIREALRAASAGSFRIYATAGIPFIAPAVSGEFRPQTQIVPGNRKFAHRSDFNFF